MLHPFSPVRHGGKLVPGTSSWARTGCETGGPGVTSGALSVLTRSRAEGGSADSGL